MFKQKTYHETDLIEGCVKQDRLCQQKLYALYHKKFYAICLRYTKEIEEAEDMLQEGFVKIFFNIKQFTGSGSFEGWMKRIIINTAIEFYRKKVIMYPVTDFEPEEGTSPEGEVQIELQANDLLKMIHELPTGYRTVFNLYAIEGYSHKEIAEMLGISEGTSKSQLARARVILQQQVNDLNKNETKSVRSSNQID